MDPSLQKIGAVKTEPGNRNVDKQVTDYISALGDHLMYTLRQKLGERVATSTPLEFIVTVPALWSDLAKEKTKQACQRAPGLAATRSPIQLISGRQLPDFVPCQN